MARGRIGGSRPARERGAEKGKRARWRNAMLETLNPHNRQWFRLIGPGLSGIGSPQRLGTQGATVRVFPLKRGGRESVMARFE